MGQKVRVQALVDQQWECLKQHAPTIDRLSETGYVTSEYDRNVMRQSLHLIMAEIHMRAAEAAEANQ